METRLARYSKKPNSKHRIPSSILNGLVILVLILLSSTIYGLIKSQGDVGGVFLFGFKPILVETGSMEPVIKTHGLVLIKKTDFDDVKIGDDISFVRENKIVIHRVISKNAAFLQTKGINNQLQDPFVITKSSGDIRGKVVYKLNATAYLASLFSSN